MSTLETAARTAKQYFLHCDNIVVTHDDENAFLLEVLYTIFNRETSENTTLEKRIEQLEAYNLTHGLGADLTIPRIIAPECIDPPARQLYRHGWTVPLLPHDPLRRL